MGDREFYKCRKMKKSQFLEYLACISFTCHPILMVGRISVPKRPLMRTYFSWSLWEIGDWMIEEIVQGQRSCDFEHKYVISVTSANTQLSHWFCSVPTATIRSLISSFLIFSWSHSKLSFRRVSAIIHQSPISLLGFHYDLFKVTITNVKSSKCSWHTRALALKRSLACTSAGKVADAATISRGTG